MKADLAKADQWMRNNPARATDLDALEASLGIKEACVAIARSCLT